MRAGWVFLVGCARPAPPVLEATAPPAEVCDVVRWHERASAPLRARIDGREVGVIADHGDRTEVIAEIGRGLLVAGDVADRKFDRVVARETALASAPGGAEMPGVLVARGTAVTGDGAWSRLQLGVPIAIAGYVPHAATARTWERAAKPADATLELPAFTDVFATTAPAAQPIAGIAGDARVVDHLRDAGSGWLAIDAHDGNVRISGFVRPARRSPLSGTYDFSDDTIEGDLVHPDGRAPHVEAGCLYASPDERASVVAISDGNLRGTPTGNGWIEVRIAAPWGRVVGYGRVALSSER